MKGGLFGDAWWKENLRMKKSTFDHLCNELRPYITRQTVVREPVSVEERVAVTLWRLATNIEYRTLSSLFGLGRSTVCIVVLDTCRAIQKLLPRYVCIPKDEKLRDIVDGFDACWGFPQCAGAIDGTHIPILRPAGDSGSDYYNRKGFYSIIMQAVVDYRGTFLDIYIGWPGKVHDARVFANSSLYDMAQHGTLLPDWKKNICGIDVPLCILGDPAYPALPWLMKAYPEHQQMSKKEKHFNYRQSRARMVVENAFGRLKGRWRCLLKRNDCHVQNVILITSACVVLHNLCEMYNDNCISEWTAAEVGADSSTSSTAVCLNANTIRDAIAMYLYSDH